MLDQAAGDQGFTRCGIVVKEDARGAAETLAALVKGLQAVNVPAVVDKRTAEAFTTNLASVPLEEMGAHCDLMIVVGGDGTLLRASRVVLADDLPVLGINLGRLGFMVDIAPKAAVETLQEILQGRYREEHRFVLQASLDDVDLGVAINDVVIRHPEPVSMLEYVTYADGRLISHHRADGLIITTPTGSTAYALSANGPMLHPATQALGLVPICPHTLSDRPLVLPADSVIEFRLVAPSDQAIITLDGTDKINLGLGARLGVSRAEKPLRLIHPIDYDWYGILRSKLSWGREKPPL